MKILKQKIQVFLPPPGDHQYSPYPQDMSPFQWLVISLLIFSSIFSPMWQMGRKLLAYQQGKGKASYGGKSWSSGSLEWDDEVLALVLPSPNYREDLAVQHGLNAAYRHSTLQHQGRVTADSQLCFPLCHFAIAPCSFISLKSLQKRGLARPRPDLKISGFPGQITY